MKKLAEKGFRTCFTSLQLIHFSDIFRLSPPQYVMRAPPVTVHVPLHTKSLCKNMACASGGANIMHPLRGGHEDFFDVSNPTLYINKRDWMNQ